jgi:hypothetical protein
MKPLQNVIQPDLLRPGLFALNTGRKGWIREAGRFSKASQLIFIQDSGNNNHELG